MDDLQMTQDGDIAILDYDVAETDSIMQRILIRLRWFLSEWIYNEDYGLPWFEKILVKSPNRSLIKSLIEAEILAVDGVTDVTELSLVWDRQTRVVSISFHAATEQGTEDVMASIDV